MRAHLSKKERDAAFDLVLSKLGCQAERMTPDWVRNEFEIFLVKVSLGGTYASEAITGLTDSFLAPAEVSKLFEACLTIEESPKLRRVAERIVLVWMFELAKGKPIDSRLHALIAEWCYRRLGSPRPGRQPDSLVKKFAIASRLIELASKYPESAYGVKKQMYGDRETKFGLKRSQLSKLINGFNPWEFIRNKASDKSD